MDPSSPLSIISHTSSIVLCILAAFLITALAQDDSTGHLRTDPDGYGGTENDIESPDFWKLKEALTSSQNGRFSKRLSATSFSFSRGKKDLSYPAGEDDVISSPIRRLSASEFFGARGRRGPPDGFFGSRGKRLLDDDTEDAEVSKRQPPKGFVVVRGKRLSPDGFFGMRGKKDSPPPFGFFGSRGKKYALSPYGFQGARGKRMDDDDDDDMLMDKKNGLPKGFFGSRGRRGNDLEKMVEESAANSKFGKLGNSMVNRWRYLVKPTHNLEDLFSKRQPSAGFYPLRG